jgi:hypothetical protein
MQNSLYEIPGILKFFNVWINLNLCW